MIAFIKNKIQKKDKGFTLLFAILVGTFIVSVSATVISIALRQTIISGTSRDSQYAFYATNTVVECLFYWDIVGPSDPDVGIVFPAEGESRNSGFDGTGITCAGGNIKTGDGFSSTFADKPWTDNPTTHTTTIYIEINNSAGFENSDGEVFTNQYCAEGTIKKEKDSATGVITTTISAKGYNTCDLTNPRTVERGLVQSYTS